MGKNTNQVTLWYLAHSPQISAKSCGCSGEEQLGKPSLPVFLSLTDGQQLGHRITARIRDSTELEPPQASQTTVAHPPHSSTHSAAVASRTERSSRVSTPSTSKPFPTSPRRQPYTTGTRLAVHCRDRCRGVLSAPADPLSSIFPSYSSSSSAAA
jgi:hypothetical protein